MNDKGLGHAEPNRLQKDELTLVTRHMDKNPSIQFWSDDEFKVRVNKDRVINFARHYGGNWFLQGDDRNWFMVELWETDDSVLQFTICLEAYLKLPIAVKDA